MAIMPAAFVTAQDKGISTVKDGQTAVGNTFNTDTAKQDSTLPFRNVNCGVSGSPAQPSLQHSRRAQLHPDFGLLIGGSALMTFRMNPATPPSNAPLYL